MRPTRSSEHPLQQGSAQRGIGTSLALLRVNGKASARVKPGISPCSPRSWWSTATRRWSRWATRSIALWRRQSARRASWRAVRCARLPARVVSHSTLSHECTVRVLVGWCAAHCGGHRLALVNALIFNVPMNKFVRCKTHSLSLILWSIRLCFSHPFRLWDLLGDVRPPMQLMRALDVAAWRAANYPTIEKHFQHVAAQPRLKAWLAKSAAHWATSWHPLEQIGTSLSLVRTDAIPSTTLNLTHLRTLFPSFIWRQL